MHCRPRYARARRQRAPLCSLLSLGLAVQHNVRSRFFFLCYGFRSGVHHAESNGALSSDRVCMLLVPMRHHLVSAVINSSMLHIPLSFFESSQSRFSNCYLAKNSSGYQGLVISSWRGRYAPNGASIHVVLTSCDDFPMAPCLAVSELTIIYWPPSSRADHTEAGNVSRSCPSSSHPSQDAAPELPVYYHRRAGLL